jgi:DNA-directed RNA polymerase specialized sigma24 family protein
MTCEAIYARACDAPSRELVARLLARRVDACSRHYARVAGSDVDDLRQEMWLGIFAALDRLDPRIGDPAQFLLQQGRFGVLAYLRRERRLRAVVALDGEPEADVCVEDEAIHSQSVRAFLGATGEPGRTIVACLLAGHSRSYVARLLGCTPANITYHLKRVEARLASVLDMEGVRSA